VNNEDNETTDVESDVAVQDQDAAVETEKAPLNLDVKVESKSACVRHVVVTIPREDIDRYYSEQFDDLLPKAEVPGFRIGKAPRKLVENKFRKQVADQVKGNLLMDSLTQVSDDQDFSAISEPDVDFETIKLPDEGSLTYEFDIEVRPEFDVPNWKGLSLERPEHEFSDKEIDQRLNQFLAQMSDLVPVDEAAEADDYITVSIVSKHDGKTISSTTEQSIQVLDKLSLGDAEIDDFSKLVKGKKAGEKISTTVTVSEYCQNEDLQGKDVELEIEVMDVKRVEPDSKDEIAEKIGVSDAEALRKLIADSLDQKLQYAQRQSVRDQICKLLTESADWELPQDLLRRQSHREMDRAVIEMRRSGFSDSEIQAQENSLRRNAMQRTETLLKEHFILERIAEEEEVQDEPQDYDMEIAKIAAQRNDSPRRVRARMEREGQMDSLRNMIIEQKVIDLITENAKFKKAKYKPDDLNDTAAIDFFVAGSPDQIPEAKYEPGEAGQLPTKKELD
jgi:trigger factor